MLADPEVRPGRAPAAETSAKKGIEVPDELLAIEKLCMT
jgi:hypothetical protein